MRINRRKSCKVRLLRSVSPNSAKVKRYFGFFSRSIDFLVFSILFHIQLRNQLKIAKLHSKFPPLKFHSKQKYLATRDKKLALHDIWTLECKRKHYCVYFLLPPTNYPILRISTNMKLVTYFLLSIMSKLHVIILTIHSTYPRLDHT